MFKYSLLLACIMSVTSIAQAIEVENRTGMPILAGFKKGDEKLIQVIHNGNALICKQFNTGLIIVDADVYFLASSNEDYSVVVSKDRDGDVVLTYKPVYKKPKL